MFAFDVDQAWFYRVIDVGKTRRITTRPVPVQQTHTGTHTDIHTHIQTHLTTVQLDMITTLAVTDCTLPVTLMNIHTAVCLTELKFNTSYEYSYSSA